MDAASERRRESLKADTAWKSQSNRFKASQGFHPDAQPWGSQVDLEAAGIVKAREQDLIECAYIRRINSMPKAPLEERMRNYFVDISQSHQWKKWSEGVRCICTSSKIYSFEENRMLCVHELARLMGHPACRPPASLTEGDLSRLVGNAISVPQIAIGLQATTCALPLGIWPIDHMEDCSTNTSP